MLIILLALVNLIYCSNTDTVITNTLGINEKNMIALQEAENAEESFDKYCYENEQPPCKCFVDDANCYNYQINEDDLTKFKTTGKCVKCNLKNVDLQGKNAPTSFYLKYDVDLSHADLSCANLSGAVFKNADFSHANLTGAQLPQVSLENCNFQNAILDFAKFNNAKIHKCDFRGASLKNTNFFMADLTESDLSYTKMCKTIFDRANLAYTSFFKSSGSYTVGYGINAGDKLFTNFCCSIKRDGTLNYQACDQNNSGYSTTSLNKCLNTVENFNLTNDQLANLAPEGLPSNTGVSSFITKTFQFPLPSEFARCNIDNVYAYELAQGKEDKRRLENPSAQTLYKNTRAAEDSIFRKTKGQIL
jgi:uncharacterized protein YjbI with pentapeptide repeats